ncbi:MAG TPA: type II toxin-antitoxin system RelE/ParE family toxin [Candidatus Thermoplasmatota archaeon]|nr:type II toxin-antitoxin system RelE/ParE family toxin [Candidatus Thermoplasmatota archaeon]
MAYAILASSVAQRELDGLPNGIADGIRLVLRAFAQEPRSKRFDVKALKGIDERPPLLRLRIGDYRVVFQIHPPLKEIHVSRIGHRRNVYRAMRGVGD